MINERFQQIIIMMQNNKKLIAIFATLALIGIFFIVLIIFSLTQKPGTQTKTQEPPNSKPFPIITSFEQQPFKVISTFPSDGATNVYAGEIIISFTTDTDIISSKSFSLDISPKLTNAWEITNSYPTKEIDAQVIGGLDTSTKYTATVRNNQGQIVHQWTFTSSSQEGESSTKQQKQIEEQQISQDYPLFDYIPYYSNDFDIEYTGPLALHVTIKNSNVDSVKQAVIDWIKSHNVDPSTHTINYTNSF